MRRGRIGALAAGVVLALSASGGGAPEAAGTQQKDWAVNTTIIEACSCTMFCSCYFVGAPTPAEGAAAAGGHAGHAGHGADAFCRANNAFRINSGHVGDVKLDGTKFWMAADLGPEFSKGFDWCVLTFEPGTTAEQRAAIRTIVHNVYGENWKTFTEGKDAKIEWSGEKERAVAKLDNGKAGEIVLQKTPGMNDEPVVIRNLKYWNAPRNDGFVLMKNEVQAYRLGEKAFETRGTNGFMITIDMKSTDVKTATASR